MDDKEFQLHKLDFRMTAVEKEIDELKDLVRAQAKNDSEFRGTLEKAMFDLMSKMDHTNDKLGNLLETVTPVVEDYRERKYGTSYLTGFFSRGKYFLALGLSLAIFMSMPVWPVIVKWFLGQ